MDKKTDIINDMEFTSLFQKSKELIDNARNNMGQMANAITVITSFLLGHYIIEQEQQGQERAKYGSKIIDSLSAYLTKEYGRGFSRSNVAGMRQFYMTYKDREDEIVQLKIGQLDIVYSKLPFKLSWTHYQVLMRIEDKDERDFYEKEAIRSGWNVSTLKRQYYSSLYERLALSRNKDDVLRLANEGAIPQKPEDIYIRHIFLSLPDWRIRHLTMKVIWNRRSLVKCRNFFALSGLILWVFMKSTTVLMNLLH